MKPWKDNLSELDKLFELRDTDGGFPMYFCRLCGRKASWTREASFSCQTDQIIPQLVLCEYPCNNHWKLEIVPDDPVRQNA